MAQRPHAFLPSVKFISDIGVFFLFYLDPTGRGGITMLLDPNHLDI